MNLEAAIPFPQIDPTIFRIGPLAVRWYGVAYVVGFLAGYLWLKRMVQDGRLQLTLDQLSNAIMWLVLGVMLGGRLGWWLVYHRDGAAVEPWYEPIAIWHGGMSFHGAVVGVVIALLIWTRRNGVSPVNLADCIALTAPVGLFFGRIANFINAELVGRPTDLPWGVVFPGESLARHPSQLYEALLEGPLLLLLVLSIAKGFGVRRGMVAAIFLVGYGVFRIGVEFTRQPDEQLGFVALGWLSMGQLLSAGLVVAGFALAGVAGRRFPHKSELSAPS